MVLAVVEIGYWWKVFVLARGGDGSKAPSQKVLMSESFTNKPDGSADRPVWVREGVEWKCGGGQRGW